MSSPVRLDLVIFGASGFTGKRVVKELTRIGRNYPDITWAVAGRNRVKLEAILQEVSKKTGEDLSKIKIIIADAEDKISIKNMCGQAKVLVNCTGPCAKFGEVVVSAAVDCKTHYVDSTVETQFIDLIKEKYDQPAREAGVYIINACGFCSIPADLGVIYLEQNFGGTVNSVDAYVTFKFAPKMHAEAKRNGMIKYSTWESSIISEHGHGLTEIILVCQEFKDYLQLPPTVPKLVSRITFRMHAEGTNSILKSCRILYLGF